jgi:hypothetical protein
MRKSFYLRELFAALFLTGIVATAPASAQKPSAEGVSTSPVTIYATTGTNTLIRFKSNGPGTVTVVGPITGLQGGENVVGIDFRPATGQLYALGSNSRLYTIDKATAAATFVAALSVALSGAEFGVDFNPIVDRLRIVSDTGQNLRVNPTNGAAIVDGALNSGTPNVTAAAYGNNYNGAATTTLFVIDSTTDTLYSQNPPNNGTLVPIGPLGINAGAVNGFDFTSANSTTFASLTVGGVTGLYNVSISSGAVTSLGVIGPGTVPYRGLAIETGSPASNLLVYGLTTNGNLITFNSSRPSVFLRSVAITGLQSGEDVRGIDVRPATGELFGVTISRLYTLNPVTGAATFAANLSTFSTGSNPIDIGVDFNPTVDRLRIVNENDANYRVNPVDGVTLTDTSLAYAAGDVNAAANPNIVAAGYTNSFAGAASTNLYDLDSNLDILVTQNPPNNGTLNTVGSLGVNFSDEAGFDIAPGNNAALAVLQVDGSLISSLYSINLATGAASFIGPTGTGLLRDIAIARNTAANSAINTPDFDGDGRTDYSIFRPSNNAWYVSNSGTNGSYSITQFGLSNVDTLTPGDYDGDGKADIAVWRDSNGIFYVLRSSDSVIQYFQFGSSGDEPAQRDYDGDGKTDYAVVRRSSGQMVWYIYNSATNTARVEQFGLPADFTAQGDYDGDGRADPGVVRGTGSGPATFYVQRSTAGLVVTQWGLASDLVVPGDYDGDGKTDYAVVRQGSPYTWYILRSSDNAYSALQFGTKPHVPTQGDYDGDGKTDISTWDPGNGNFYVQRSTGQLTTFLFGSNGDIPVASYDTH